MNEFRSKIVKCEIYMLSVNFLDLFRKIKFFITNRSRCLETLHACTFLMELEESLLHYCTRFTADRRKSVKIKYQNCWQIFLNNRNCSDHLNRFC